MLAVIFLFSLMLVSFILAVVFTRFRVGEWEIIFGCVAFIALVLLIYQICFVVDVYYLCFEVDCEKIKR